MNLGSSTRRQQMQQYYHLVCERQQQASRRNQALQHDARRAHVFSLTAVDTRQLEALKSQYLASVANIYPQWLAQVNVCSRPATSGTAGHISPQPASQLSPHAPFPSLKHQPSSYSTSPPLNLSHITTVGGCVSPPPTTTHTASQGCSACLPSPTNGYKVAAPSTYHSSSSTTANPLLLHNSTPFLISEPAVLSLSHEGPDATPQDSFNLSLPPFQSVILNSNRPLSKPLVPPTLKPLPPYSKSINKQSTHTSTATCTEPSASITSTAIPIHLNTTPVTTAAHTGIPTLSAAVISNTSVCSPTTTNTSLSPALISSTLDTSHHQQKPPVDIMTLPTALMSSALGTCTSLQSPTTTASSQPQSVLIRSREGSEPSLSQTPPLTDDDEDTKQQVIGGDGISCANSFSRAAPIPRQEDQHTSHSTRHSEGPMAQPLRQEDQYTSTNGQEALPLKEKDLNSFIDESAEVLQSSTLDSSLLEHAHTHRDEQQRTVGHSDTSHQGDNDGRLGKVPAGNVEYPEGVSKKEQSDESVTDLIVQKGCKVSDHSERRERSDPLNKSPQPSLKEVVMIDNGDRAGHSSSTESGANIEVTTERDLMEDASTVSRGQDREPEPQSQSQDGTDAYATFLQSVRQTTSTAPPLLDSDSEGIEDMIAGGERRVESKPSHHTSSPSPDSTVDVLGVVGRDTEGEASQSPCDPPYIPTAVDKLHTTQSKVLQRRLGFWGSSDSSLDDSEIEAPTPDDDQGDFDFNM